MKISVKKLFLFIFCLCPIFIQAQHPDVISAVTLSKKLNELKMYDYSIFLLEQTMKDFPADADKVKIQLGLTYFTQGKMDEGEKIINSITSSSKYFLDSRRVFGLAAIMRGKTDVGINALEEYFKVKLKNPPKDEDDKNEFLEAWQYLLAAYQQKKDLKKVDEVLKYRDILESKEDKESSPLGDREGKLLAIQIKLDAIEDAKKEGKSGWQTEVNKFIKELDELKWGGVDSIFVVAEVEQARCLYLLDRYADALAALNKPSTKQNISSFDDAYKKINKPSNAPSVLAAYVEGLVYLAQGDKAATNEDKISLYSKALGKFYWIVANHTEFPKYEKVIRLFSSSKQKLEELGKNIKIPKAVLDKINKTVSLRKKEADRLFQENKFDAAIPIYLEEIKRSRHGENAADCLTMLSFCFTKTDRPLEAMAIAWYLAERFPKYSKTPNAILQVGEYLWGKNEVDSALIVYKYYLEACPTDQHAGAISARIAKYFYDKALELGKAARALPPGAEKTKKNAEAKQAFIDAIPYYYNIIENFQHTDYGRTAFYMLGLCYYNAREYLKAAEVFLEFANRESKITKDKIQLADIADAKSRAAESYFQFANNADKELKALREKFAVLQKLSLPSDKIEEGDVEQKGEETQDLSPSPSKESISKEQKSATDEAELNAEQIAAKIKELEKLTVKYFNEAIKHCKELIEMFEKGGLLENEKSAKAISAKENAAALIGWSYDGLKEKEKAIEQFKKFSAAFPQSKQTPGAIQRAGILLSEIGKFEESAKVLEELAKKFPDSKEGKQAMPMLARSMYEIKNYTKSIEVFSDIIQKKTDVSIFDLRWALDKLSDCGGTNPKEGAAVALAAGRILLEKIQQPVIEDWIGKTRAAQIANDPKAIKNNMDILREKILFDSARAAYHADEYDEAIKYLDELLKNEKTPYYYDAKFLRGSIYQAKKDYKKALDDFGEISFASNISRNFGIYYKSQALIGDIYIEQELYKQALGAFAIIAMVDLDEWFKDEKIKALPLEERAEQLKWIEYAIYKAALCSAKLGDTTDKEKYKEQYKKHFPKGNFISEIEKI